MKPLFRALPLSLALCFCACTPAAPTRMAVTEFALGTFCTINLFDRHDLYAEVFQRLHELEGIFSANRPDTDLDRVNRNAGLWPVKVRPELIEVLETALVFAEKSQGYFDPSVGPLVKLWGIGAGDARIPGEDEIRLALKLINYRDIEVNPEEGTVFLKHEGMALDLGAIAKGYAADEIARFLVERGANRAIIDLGGDIFALGERQVNRGLVDSLKDLFSGSKETGNIESFWRIGIQDPENSRGYYIGVLRVKNKSVVTSGTYERFFEEDGKRYHHIFSIENGFPVENGLLSVTVSADNCIDADALSTAAFSMGWERGMELIASVPGAGGIFVFEDFTVRLTEGIKEHFSLMAGEYRLAQ